MDKLRVDVWSDIACPWCWIGKRNLDRALASFAHAADVDVVWRSFELDPGAPREHRAPLADRLAAKYRMSVATAEAMIARVTEAGAAAGIDFHFERVREGNT